MVECEHLARTSAYFDGALSPADEASAVEHLASCVPCQQLLGDAVGLDAVLSTAPRVTVAAAPARRRWPLVVAVAGGLAAAAGAIYFVGVREPAARQVAIELPRERTVEARFSGERFAPHRPYGVLRGDRATDSIPLSILAELEQRGHVHDLVAALASTGNVARAREVAAKLPVDAAAESDRAALALVDRDTEAALEHAYRAVGQDPQLVAAWWNLGLAARERGLARVSRAAFQRVAQHAEPGWGDEARAQIVALDRELAPQIEYAEFNRRGRAMVAGGPLIELADVRRFPTFARVYVLDALRVASGAGVEPLRPLAKELDAISGVSTMIAAADHAAAADPAIRGRFADRYRAVVARTASEEQIKKLIADLRAAGPAVDDVRASTIITGEQVAGHLAELRAIVEPWDDPWFDLVVERWRISTSWPATDLRTERALTAALAGCTKDVWGLRCGQFAQELGALLYLTGRPQDAEKWAAVATDWYRRAVAPEFTQFARTFLAEIHRNLGRNALARAELEEVSLAIGDSRCGLRRFLSIAQAHIAHETDDRAAVRAALPPPIPPQGCSSGSELQGIATAIDFARRTGDPKDLAIAGQWIEAARTLTGPDQEGIALIASARLARGTDPAAVAAVQGWLTAHPADATSPVRGAARTWGFITLLSEAGAREAWSDVLAIAAREHPASAQAACRVVASYDDGDITVAARTPDGAVGGHRRIEPAELATAVIVPPAVAKALASCPAISVTARPPLHGRADLLPPELPWWFAGDAPAHEPGGPARAIEINNPRPPDTSLPPLAAAAPSTERFDVSLTGADATPSRVLAALGNATYAELHAHGVVTATDENAAFLALSPEPDGAFALRADMVRRTKLNRAPLVVLAACRAAAVAPSLRQRWSLPDAFLAAGAHAVVAVDVAIPDASARRVFDELHRRIDAGEPVATAVAAIRANAKDETAWARRLMVFR